MTWSHDLVTSLWTYTDRPFIILKKQSKQTFLYMINSKFTPLHHHNLIHRELY